MSGIVGIVNFDNRPGERELAQRMAGTMKHRGPDGVRVWAGEGAALAHCALRSTPESLHEIQPAHDGSCELTLVADARLDNREELLEKLSVPRGEWQSFPDVSLLLRAYERWDDNLTGHLLGDFAFAVWDHRRRRLLCARDPFGTRPLYYFSENGRFGFASEIKALLIDARIRREPDEMLVAEILTDSVSSTDRTLFRDIRRLPAGTQVVCDGRTVAFSRYWEPKAQDLSYRRDEEFAEHFGEILDRAVRDRMRSSGAVAIELGGLDSSAIAVLAQRSEPQRRITSYSEFFPGWDCNERSYIEEVGKFCGLSQRGVDFRPPQATFFQQQAARYADLPDYPNNGFLDGLRKLARDDGNAVLLTGSGADDWLSAINVKYADLVASGRPVEFLRQFRADSARGLSLRGAVSASVTPFLSPTMLRRVRRMVGTAAPPSDWLGPKLPRNSSSSPSTGEGRRSRPGQFLADTLRAHLKSGLIAHHMEMDERAAAQHQLDARHPYFDRRLVEFCLALPVEQRQRGPVTKFILRKAMCRLLPRSVVERTDKAEHSRTFYETLAAMGGEGLFRNLAIGTIGWVQEDAARAKYRVLDRLFRAGDDSYRAHQWILWGILSVEWWYRAIFDGAGS